LAVVALPQAAGGSDWDAPAMVLAVGVQAAATGRGVAPAQLSLAGVPGPGVTHRVKVLLGAVGGMLPLG
jgi:hypothetical protein